MGSWILSTVSVEPFRESLQDWGLVVLLRRKWHDSPDPRGDHGDPGLSDAPLWSDAAQDCKVAAQNEWVNQMGEPGWKKSDPNCVLYWYTDVYAIHMGVSENDKFRGEW